ncbi:hypothetical protein AEYBE204_13275 [Asticcacaulis sp. YBE204]|nr:hypothetical protein AEYBE204_13275 [Asticcacaulis sp. YBE204]
MDTRRPPSFRGVAFEVDSNSRPIGRRVQIDEYPLRDYASSEDLGAKARTFGLEALIVGDDYVERRNRFEDALEQPGPGELIHPSRGRLWVVLVSGDISESSSESGMVRYSLTFAEIGERPARTEATDTAAVAQTSAEAVGEVAAADFTKGFSIGGQPDWVLTEAGKLVGQAQDRFDTLASRLSGYGQPLNDFIARGKALRSGVLTLAGSPASLGTEVTGLIQGFRQLARTPGDALSLLKGLMTFGLGFDAPATTTSGRKRQAANQAAIIDLIETTAAAEAVRAAADLSFASYDEAVATRDALSDALEDLGLAAAEAGHDDAAQAIEDARLAISADINARGADLARLTTFTPVGVEPAVVIAYRLYGPANLEARELDIVSRNRIRHPGFVPAGLPLEVLNG